MANGQRKPEGVSAATAHLLTGGLGRCGLCGGALSPHKHKFYRCSKRAPGKPCSNATAIPIAELEESVREALRSALVENQDATADVLVEKVAEERQAHETRLAAWKAEHQDRA